ncbi:MAG: molybdopterin-dependent oxidoreductase [Pseudoxanthomonas sp.]
MTASAYCTTATALLLFGAIPSLRAQDHSHASEPTAPSPVSVPLDEATLAALPRTPVVATAHGKTLNCAGVRLSALLTHAGVLSAEPLRGPALADYVLVTARDGYRAVYSLGELEPTLGNNDVVLVNRCDDQPLSDDSGPLRLIAPEESRPARWVRQVQSITVVAAP